MALVWGAYAVVSAGRGTVGALPYIAASSGLLWSASVIALSGWFQNNERSLRRLAWLYAMFMTAVLALATTEAAWSVIWISLFPLLMPGDPRRVLRSALLAASVSPIAHGLVTYAGLAASKSLLELVSQITPAIVAAGLAYAGARVLAKLGAQVSDAADMGMYQLESPIALGGMGEVWRAKHRLLSRPAAVKLIRGASGAGSRGSAGSVAEQRFAREAQVTAALKSPHTVELYDFGVTDSGTFYYVMELLEGSTLEELVQREGPLEPARVAHIMGQILDSLSEAHQQGLVHRDIKPANLHVSRRGLIRDFVKVLDFGLVKRTRPLASEPSLSLENSIVGTPAYLAPEVITGKSEVDARSDLYSLGCVAYYLLTGSRVFEGDSTVAMAIAHATAKPEPPSARLGRPILPGLEQLVLKCLEKSPEHRPQSAVELLRLLQALKLAEPESSKPAGEWPLYPNATILQPAVG